MNPDNPISNILAGNFSNGLKGSFGFLAGTIFLGVLAPNKSDQLGNYFLKVFFQPRGLAALAVGAVVGYLAGNLWTSGEYVKKLLTVTLTVIYVAALGAAYWYLNFYTK